MLLANKSTSPVARFWGTFNTLTGSSDVMENLLQEGFRSLGSSVRIPLTSEVLPEEVPLLRPDDYASEDIIGERGRQLHISRE